jgi:hypothetical protein
LDLVEAAWTPESRLTDETVAVFIAVFIAAVLTAVCCMVWISQNPARKPLGVRPERTASRLLPAPVRQAEQTASDHALPRARGTTEEPVVHCSGRSK